MKKKEEGTYSTEATTKGQDLQLKAAKLESEIRTPTRKQSGQNDHLFLHNRATSELKLILNKTAQPRAVISFYLLSQFRRLVVIDRLVRYNFGCPFNELVNIAF